MSPRRQPHTLFDISVKRAVSVINNICCEHSVYSDDYEPDLPALNLYLRSMLPARLLDVLTTERNNGQHYQGDPRMQLRVLTHPQLSVFRKSNLDNLIPISFWPSFLSNFHDLVVLDLKFVCSDEILQVIGCNCPKIQELNIVSKVDVCRFLFNASVLIRNVSDEGLQYVGKLKQLRVLTMDPPRNGITSKIGRGVTQTGIVKLIKELPCLQDLRIDTCDIGSILLSANSDIGPLSLQKISCHSTSGASINRLLQICPNVRELSVTHLSVHNKDDTLIEIAKSNCEFSRLDLSFFSYSPLVVELLSVKGKYLTCFTLFEVEFTLTFDGILEIGKFCPNLTTVCLITQSWELVVPSNAAAYTKMGYFKKLEELTIGNGVFNIENFMNFFMECSSVICRLVVKYQTKMKIDDVLTKLLARGRFKNICSLWFDCTLEVSTETVLALIASCEHLRSLTIDHAYQTPIIHRYIANNNLELELGMY